MLMGSHVTKTIKGGIVEESYFIDSPVLLMFGMTTVVFGCAFWLVASTLWSLPVSSTHTCIGGMLGMAFVSRGFHAVQWKSVINVILSWFYTPVIAGCISFLFFSCVRACILKKEKSFEYSLNFFSPMVAFTLAINIFVVIYHGCPWIPVTPTLTQAILITLGITLLIGLVLHFTFVPHLRRRGENIVNKVGEQTTDALLTNPQEPASEPTPTEASVAVPPPKTPSNEASPKKSDMDVFESLESDAKVAEMHKNAEVYDPKTESVFVSLQILAAILNSFAHGANDVSHSIGPFAACIAIYQSGKVGDTSPSPAWILAFGALGIIIGLATMGYKVMATVGVNLVPVTPCRGFFIELAASFVVIVASWVGLPISTTQCKIGAAVGIGLVGGAESVNWKLFAKIFLGWIGTIAVAAVVSATLMFLGSWAFHLNSIVCCKTPLFPPWKPQFPRFRQLSKCFPPSKERTRKRLISRYLEKLYEQLPEPKGIWEYFLKITQIPRGSNQEGENFRHKQILAFLKAEAEKLGCETYVDKGDNLIVRKAAFPGIRGGVS